jgi:hypothetical protein
MYPRNCLSSYLQAKKKEKNEKAWRSNHHAVYKISAANSSIK